MLYYTIGKNGCYKPLFTIASSMILATTMSQAVAKVNVGGGLRTSFSSVENAAPNGSDRSSDFDLNSIRLYVNGDVYENIKFTLNTEIDGNDKIRILDGIAQFEFSDMVNIWAGRFLPPSDRSNLSGPYYLNNWFFPSVQAYPAIFAGRDDGVAYWGQSGEGQFKWQVGAFEGPQTVNDDLLYSARFVANFWDPEPGYYNSSTYYGDKDVLAVGLTYQTQDSNDAYSLDFLMEMKFNTDAVVSFEGAYYNYDGLGGLGGQESDGYFVQASYLFGDKIGIGQFQPVIRYTEGDVDQGAQGDMIDVNLNYIIKGHNARISFAYQDRNDTLFGDTNIFTIGLQLQM